MLSRFSLQVRYKLKFYPFSLHTLVSIFTGAKTAQRRNSSAPKSTRPGMGLFGATGLATAIWR